MCQIVFFGGKAWKSKCAVLSVKQQACQINMCATNKNSECFGESHAPFRIFQCIYDIIFSKKIYAHRLWDSLSPICGIPQPWEACLKPKSMPSYCTRSFRNSRLKLWGQFEKDCCYWRKPWFFKKPYVLEIHLCFYKMIEGLVPEIHELLCWRTHIFIQELGFAGFCFKITLLFRPQPVSMII